MHKAPVPGLMHSISQGSFELQAYKSGMLKPSKRDPIVDRTVTEFTDPSPSKHQLALARATYSALGAEWGRRVEFENHQQDVAKWKQFERSMHFRPRGMDSRTLGHLTRLDARLQARSHVVLPTR